MAMQPVNVNDYIGKDLVLTRVFDAPRAVVYKAWTNEKYMAQWWGPHGFTTPVCEMDVRPGGAMRICMDAPGFPNHWTKGTFIDVDEPARLSFKLQAFLDDSGESKLETHNTAVFDEADGKTTLTLTVRLVSATADMGMAVGGMQEGWTQSLQRLDATIFELMPDVPAERQMSITRVLNAPRELVFKVWTEPAHIAQWWGPDGFTNTIHKMDVRPGGFWNLTMHGQGTDFPNQATYIDVVKPERLVFLHGTGLAGDASLFLSTVTFKALSDKQTEVSMRGLFMSKDIFKHVVEQFGALEGNRQTFARMEKYISSL